MALSTKATLGLGMGVFAIAMLAGGPMGLAAAEAFILSLLVATVFMSLLHTTANGTHSGFFFWPRLHRPFGGAVTTHSRTFVPTGPAPVSTTHSRTFVPTAPAPVSTTHSRTFIPSGGPSVGTGFLSGFGGGHGMTTTHSRTFVPTR